MQNTLLGGQTPHAFMRAHWQKRPLLVRRALPGFRGVIARRALERLAARDDVESRLIECSRNRWRVTHGPLTRTRLARAGSTDWTLLVQGLNLHLEAADRLLRRFAFLPQARLDDVMVSYAAPGGGVGPHADSYDVFLLQGEGRRVWRLARPRDWVFAADAPLKLIEDFRADDEYLLEPGDMLYLPPGWGHEGVALEPCFTYSIGFRAPQGAELAAAGVQATAVVGDLDLFPVMAEVREDRSRAEVDAGSSATALTAAKKFCNDGARPTFGSDNRLSTWLVYS